MTNKKIEQQKKLLLVLPVLVVPFLTLFFWSLGGGQNASAQSGKTGRGINAQLPGAHLHLDSAEDKMSFYANAEKDSDRIKQAQHDDPYYRPDTVHNDNSAATGTGIIGSAERLGGGGFNYLPSNTQQRSLAYNEQAINERLAAITRAVNQPPATTETRGSEVAASGDQRKQLADMMSRLNSNTSDDPEMKQLSGMLDKILDIEHPDLVRQKLKAQSEKQRGLALPVSNLNTDSGKTLMREPGQTTGDAANGFYDLETNAAPAADNAISAVVHQTQTLTAGSTIKMRLLQDIYINGHLIPKDNFVFGTCAIDGDRLTVDIKTLRYRNSIFPVSMKVLDQDGITGIYVPGAITRDAAKDGADQAIQSLDYYSMSPSFGAQAASAGVQAVKGLFSKKVKLIKVTVKAGYNVLLANSNQLNQ